MSRVGKLPIQIPKGVSVEVRDGVVVVKGPKGELTQRNVDHIEPVVEGPQVLFRRSSESKQARSNHGLMRALVNNMVVGVTRGFTRELQVIGIGYRAEVKGRMLELHLGYSHPIEHPIPAGVAVEVDRNNKITIQGIDRQQIGQLAANIRDHRKPDHYKGKGIRHVGEYVRIKAGKSA